MPNRRELENLIISKVGYLEDWKRFPYHPALKENKTTIHMDSKDR